jgi:hypothetical protein
MCCPIGSGMWICMRYKEKQTKIHLSFIYKTAIAIAIHYSLPVSSGFHMDTRAFRSLLRVVYALPTAQGTCNTNAILSPAISRMTLCESVVC